MGPPAGQQVAPWVGGPGSRSVSRSDNPSVGRSPSIGYSVGRRRSERRPVGLPVDRSDRRPVGRSVRWRGGRPPIFVKTEIKLNSHLSDSDRCEILSYFERRPCRSYNTTLGAAGFAKNLLCAWGRCRRLIALGGISGRLGANVGDFAAKRVPLKRVAWAWPPGHPRSFSEGFQGGPRGSGAVWGLW